MNEMDRIQVARDRLHALIRGISPGGCKVLSQSECECPLCDVDYLVLRARVYAVDALLAGPSSPAHEPPVHGSEVLCPDCAVVFCPHGERLHFHHDGCPACVSDEPEPAALGLLTSEEQDTIWTALNACVLPLSGKPGFICEHCREAFPFEHPRTDCHIAEARDLFARLLNDLAATRAARPAETPTTPEISMHTNALQVLQDKLKSWCDDEDQSQPIDFICGVSEFVDDVLKAAPPPAVAPAPSGWQPIETFPLTHRDRECWFWLEPKSADETYCDGQGRPITADVQPFAVRTRFGAWGSLFKATDWQPSDAPLPPASTPSETR